MFLELGCIRKALFFKYELYFIPARNLMINAITEIHNYNSQQTAFLYNPVSLYHALLYQFSYHENFNRLSLIVRNEIFRLNEKYFKSVEKRKKEKDKERELEERERREKDKRDILKRKKLEVTGKEEKEKKLKMEELKVEIEARKKEDLSFKIEEEMFENSEENFKLESVNSEKFKSENVKSESVKLDLNNNVIEATKSGTPEPELFNLFFENLGKEKHTPEKIETEYIEKTELEKTEFKQKIGLITSEIESSPPSQLLTIFAAATPFKYTRQKLLEINDNPNKQILDKVKKQITLSKALTRAFKNIHPRDILAGKLPKRSSTRNNRSSKNSSFCETYGRESRDSESYLNYETAENLSENYSDFGHSPDFDYNQDLQEFQEKQASQEFPHHETIFPDTTQLDQASDQELCNLMSPTLNTLNRRHSSYDRIK